MHKDKYEIAKETARELGISVEDVLEVIDSIETLVTQNIRRTTEDTIYETRIMGFGSFIGKKDKALKRLLKNK